MWIFLLLFSGCTFSSQQQIHVGAWYNDPAAAASSGEMDSKSSSDSFASPEEKEELYTRALYTVYPIGYDEINERIKVYLDRVVLQSTTAPDDYAEESNIALLRRLQSGDLQDTHQAYIKRLVMRATSQAFEDQQKKLEEQKKETEEKFSKVSTGVIALISSTVTCVTSVIIAIYSQK